MEIERDEFVVTFDAGATSIDTLLAASKAVGFEASFVAAESTTEAESDSFFNEAIARARRENRPVVIDFTAAWCEPCQRMLRDTFPDAKVDALLEECVFVKVDTDEHPQLAKRFGVVGLPDIRFLSPNGNEVRRFLDFQGPAEFAVALEGLLQTTAAPLDDGTLVALSEGDTELKEAFNRDAGHVRLVLILSPT